MPYVDGIEYSRLPAMLKRYKLQDKMRYAETYSRQLMYRNVRNNPAKLREGILPWELESFVLLSIKAEEWTHNDLEQRRFIQIINGIRNAEHPVLVKKEENEQFAKWLVMVLAATQFDYEESFWHKMYRVSYYFSYVSGAIDMSKEFQMKFDTDYQKVLTFSLALWIIYISEIKDINFCKSKLIEQCPKEVELLTISREDFIVELEKNATAPIDYLYCLRPSYSYPFIRCKEDIYLPLPHLLPRAATSSLVFRLTDGNDRLREIIGREVFESYLFSILSSYQEFEQVEKEIIYTKGKFQNQRSADVMTHIGNQIICFDSKSYVPKVALRTFSETAYSAELSRLGKAVKQMYEQIHNKFGVEYNPFDIIVDDDKSNIWGIVVVSENPFINLEDIYAETRKLLKPEITDKEFEWLKGHIGIASLSSIEHQVFSSGDILSVIQRNSKMKKFNDAWFARTYPRCECDEIRTFKNKQIELACNMLKMLPGVVLD